MSDMSNTPKEKVNTNEILRHWLKSQKKSVADFNREMGYWSNYAYQLTAIHNPRPITHETIGRLLVTYGLDGPALKIAEAVRKEQNGEH